MLPEHASLTVKLPFILGVIADTHVPDRAPRLHPKAVETFQQAGVTAILHAGDICVPAVLEELEHVAPVFAVRGNRDWLLPDLPQALDLQAGDLEIGLTHGHGGWSRYLIDKLQYLLHGYHLERYVSSLQELFPNAGIVVFGHTHRPVCEWVDGRLFFNPGSAGAANEPARTQRSVGLIHVDGSGKIKGEWIPLDSV